MRGSINRAWNDGDVEWRIKGALTADVSGCTTTISVTEMVLTATSG